jgi:hypothetical protein
LKLKHHKLVFMQSIDRLKSYLYYLLLVLGAGVACARVASAGGARAGGGWGVGRGGSSAMVSCLQATAAAVLTSLASTLLGVLDEAEQEEGVLVLAR